MKLLTIVACLYLAIAFIIAAFVYIMTIKETRSWRYSGFAAIGAGMCWPIFAVVALRNLIKKEAT